MTFRKLQQRNELYEFYVNQCVHTNQYVRSDWSMVYCASKLMKNRTSSILNYGLCTFNISDTRNSVSSGYPNSEKRIENTTRGGVFLTKLEVFG